MEPNILVIFIVLFPAMGAAAGFLAGMKSETFRNILLIFVTFINLAVVICLYSLISDSSISVYIPYIMGTGLYLKLDIFRYVFVFITAMLWFIVTVYSSQYLINYRNRNRYYLFFMITYASTVGVFLSDNLLNLFTFYEIMSFCSYPMIIHDEDEHAHDASATYIWMTTLSGLLLLMGIFIGYSYTNTLSIREMGQILSEVGNIRYLIGGLMIAGFGIKAGMVPLHIWLPKAHPAAPTPASAVLSGVLVKTGIFGIIVVYFFLMSRDYYISFFLIAAGLVNMVVGGIYAMFQINIKKTLAFSSISQLGYLFIGIGCIGLLPGHEEIAIYGTLFHVVNHAVYKVMLFMGVGIIFMVTHNLNINDLRGFGRYKPVLKLTFFTGFCAIIGIPGFNGFASKTMIHHALTEAIHMSGAWWLAGADLIFYAASAFTTAYLVKIYLALFVENNPRYYADYKKSINLRALFPMVASSVCIVALGIFPNLFVNALSGISSVFGVGHTDEVFSISFFTAGNIVSAVITIVIGVIIYRYLILSKMTATAKDGRRIFINVSENKFELERNVYIPAVRSVHWFSFKVLHIVDNILYGAYQAMLRSARLGGKIRERETAMDMRIRMIYEDVYGEKEDSEFPSS